MIRINYEFLDLIENLRENPEYQSLITAHNFKSGHVILDQNSKVNNVYMVKEGLTKCYLTEDTGKDFIQEFFGPGEIFGELEIFSETYSFCAIETVSQVSLYKITHKGFVELLKKHKEFNWLMLKSLASKVKYKAIRHSFNQSHNTETNLMRLKSEHENIYSLIPKKDLANYLGVTERNLNRAINRLKESV
ncbi:Crp/Fnr family transcriptional regulator [Roseivirga seohaensis]|uniref:Crp/Fnr family transcriptional regulator n=1 Tax=Roseivirga seohaensis TaxID=1914963 RepID=UPI003BA8817B